MASNKNTQRHLRCPPTSCSVEGNFRSVTLSRDPGTRRERKYSTSRHLKKPFPSQEMKFNHQISQSIKFRFCRGSRKQKMGR